MKDYARYPVPDVKNLKEYVAWSVKQHGGHDAFRTRLNANEYASVTYNQFNDHMRALGTWFMKQGMDGAKIAVLGETATNG